MTRVAAVSSTAHNFCVTEEPIVVRPSAPTIANMTAVKSASTQRRSITNSLSDVPRVLSKYVLADQRVVKHGLSLPIIFFLSAAIGVSYAIAFAASGGVEWIPRDLTGENEWKTRTRTHLARDPLELLADLLLNTTIGADTSVNVNFISKYGVVSEAVPESARATFQPAYLQAEYILQNGITIAGQMAGAFEAYGVWPCHATAAHHPVLSNLCKNVANDWFTIQVYNNLVATTSEHAETYLSPRYTPMALMTARIWPSQRPTVKADGTVVVSGVKKGTYTDRIYYLLKTEGGELTLTTVTPCDRTTQSDELECDHLETEDIYVRNYATRDFHPPHKLDKLGVYGPALAMGNFVAAGKTFVMLPGIAIDTTNTGYESITRFSTNLPFRLTITDSSAMLVEFSVSQVASFTPAVGNGFATATAQMAVVCLIVYNAIAHCHTTDEIVRQETHIFGFYNCVTMGCLVRRLGTYKFVCVQLGVYHFLNIGSFFSAVFYGTQKLTDTISFVAEGFLLVIVASMLLDQLFFFEKYSSTREYWTVVLSCAFYPLLLYLNTSFFLTAVQVPVTEHRICGEANSCNVLHGFQYYYVGLVAALVVPVAIVNGPIHWFVTPTRSRSPLTIARSDDITTFEHFCLGTDARVEFGDFSRAVHSGATPISIVHAAGFTYMGPYLVRIKDFYMVVLSRWLPAVVVESSGLTLTVFEIYNGRVVTGKHVMLRVAYKLLRDAKHDQYTPIA